MNKDAGIGGDFAFHPVALLPLYVNGRLEGPARKDVEGHLALCAVCRGELEDWEEIAFAVEEEVANPPDPEGAWDKLFSRIEKEKPPAEPEARGLKRWLGWGSWRPAHSLAWGLVAAQFALIAGLSVYIAVRGSGGREWAAIGGPALRAEPAGLRLRVVFRETATVEQVGRLAGMVGGQIARGPNPQGVYEIYVPPTAGRAGGIEAALDPFWEQRDIVVWVQADGAGKTERPAVGF